MYNTNWKDIHTSWHSLPYSVSYAKCAFYLHHHPIEWSGACRQAEWALNITSADADAGYFISWEQQLGWELGRLGHMDTGVRWARISPPVIHHINTPSRSHQSIFRLHEPALQSASLAWPGLGLARAQAWCGPWHCSRVHMTVCKQQSGRSGQRPLRDLLHHQELISICRGDYSSYYTVASSTGRVNWETLRIGYSAALCRGDLE